jgi:hypothetical protein
MGTPKTHGTFRTRNTDAPKSRNRHASMGMPPSVPHCSQSLWAALMNTPKSLEA